MDADISSTMIETHRCHADEPTWAHEILKRLDYIFLLEEYLMADLDQAVADLKAAVSAAASRVAADIATLKDELAKAGGVSDAAQAAADSIEATVADLNNIDPVPAPAPDPAPAPVDPAPTDAPTA